MAWFKVDDRLHASRKVKSIPRNIRLEAMGLWVLSGSWAAGEPLDGFVPDFMVDDFGGRPELVDALVKSGLWVPAAEGASFHAWTEYNPDAETVAAAKEAKSEGAKHANHKRWHVKRKVKVPGCEWCRTGSDPDRIPDQFSENKANPPDPTRPDPTNTKTPKTPHVGKGGAGDGRATRIPAPFIVTTPMREWAAREVPNVDVDASTQMFVDHWRGESGARARKLDWVATWRNWLRRDAKSGTRPSATKQARADENAAEYYRLYGGTDERAGSVPALDPGVS